MGNCVRKGTVSHWTDDEWDSPVEAQAHGEKPSELVLKLKMERDMLVDKKEDVGNFGKQVKIKMTKKELEELMMGGGKLGNDQSCTGLLSELIKVASRKNSIEERGRSRSYASWRPSLESIEELD